MAVNKSNPVTHWAGATATLHPMTPSFLWQKAAQGPGPINKHGYNTPHCPIHLCLPILPHGSRSAWFIFQLT